MNANERQLEEEKMSTAETIDTISMSDLRLSAFIRGDSPVQLIGGFGQLRPIR